MTFYIALVVVTGSARPLQSQEENPLSPQTLPAVAATPFELPVVQLAPRVPNVDETTFKQSVAAKSTQFLSQADATTDPLSKATLLLAAANQLLAYDLEPACSRRLLELDRGPMPAEIPAVLDRVDQILARVGAALDEVAGPRGDNPKLLAAASHLDVLNAFSRSLRAVLDDATDEESVRRARRAASALSVLLEESNPAVSGSAMLWQAVLRAREVDPAGAIGILEPPLADLPRPTITHAFFARMLRTRLLARQGSFAASLALLAQMEDRCTYWFLNEQERNDCTRTVNWYRLLTLRDWSAKFPGDNTAPSRAWCAEQFRSFCDEAFKEEPKTLLRLGTAVPLVADAPQDAGRSPDNRE